MGTRSGAAPSPLPASGAHGTLSTALSQSRSLATPRPHQPRAFPCLRATSLEHLPCHATPAVYHSPQASVLALAIRAGILWGHRGKQRRERHIPFCAAPSAAARLPPWRVNERTSGDNPRTPRKSISARRVLPPGQSAGSAPLACDTVGNSLGASVARPRSAPNHKACQSKRPPPRRRRRKRRRPHMARQPWWTSSTRSTGRRARC